MCAWQLATKKPANDLAKVDRYVTWTVEQTPHDACDLFSWHIYRFVYLQGIVYIHFRSSIWWCGTIDFFMSWPTDLFYQLSDTTVYQMLVNVYQFTHLLVSCRFQPFCVLSEQPEPGFRPSCINTARLWRCCSPAASFSVRFIWLNIRLCRCIFSIGWICVRFSCRKSPAVAATTSHTLLWLTIETSARRQPVPDRHHLLTTTEVERSSFLSSLQPFMPMLTHEGPSASRGAAYANTAVVQYGRCSCLADMTIQTITTRFSMNWSTMETSFR